MSDSVTPMDCSMPVFPLLHCLLEFAQTHVHLFSDAIQPSHSLSTPFPPALNLSQHHGLFKWVSFLDQVPKYWSFSFSISPSNEYSGLVSFRIDWFDLLADQGTLESLLSLLSTICYNYLLQIYLSLGKPCFPSGASCKESDCQWRRHKRLRFDPWVGKIPWRRKWQPTPIFLTGKFHGQRSLVDTTEWLNTHTILNLNLRNFKTEN